MNGWLGQVSLRIVDRGPMGLNGRLDGFPQHSPFLGGAELSQPPKCCNLPDGTSKCFDHSTEACINTWNNGTPIPGAPDCVVNIRGEEVHPDCYNSLAPPTALSGRSRRIPLYNLGSSIKDLPEAQPLPTRPLLGKWQPHGWKFWERKPKSSQPAATASTSTSPDPTPSTGQKIACVNGPDLYDVYNSDMTLVEKAVLHPEVKYPGIQFANFPPCPVPQATGVGGLCDIPAQYLAPKDPNGPPGKPVLACFDERGVTLLDYVTGAPIGTHFNASCLSLLSDVTRAQPGDSRCTFLAPVTTPPSGGTGTTPPSGGTSTTPPSGGSGTTPPSGGAGGTLPVSGVEGTSAIAPGGGSMPIANAEPMPATGGNGGGFLPVLPPPQNMTRPASPTGAFPGQPFAATPALQPQRPIPTVKAPAPLPPPCPLGPVPLKKWVEGCMGT